VLRATYVDPTHTVVATAGIVVLERAQETQVRVEGAERGAVRLVRPFRVADTEAARFRDGQAISSGLSMLWRAPGAPYLVTVVVGAADGRVAARLPKAFDGTRQREADRAEWRSLGDGARDALVDTLTQVIRRTM
jgi:hypothetical protein